MIDRKRIAYFAVNPAVSGADRAILEGVRAVAEVDLFYDSFTLKEYFKDEPKARAHNEYHAANSLERYDLRFYHMGDSIYFRDHYEMLISEPGVVILHDWALHRFHLAYAAVKNDLEWYVKEASWSHKEAGERLARAVIAGLGSEFAINLIEMNRRVIEGSLGVIAPNGYVERQVQACFPDKPVICIEDRDGGFAGGPQVKRDRLVISYMADVLCNAEDIELVVRVFKRLHDEHGDASFIIFGSYPEGRIRSILRKCGAEGSVSWMGASTREKVLNHISGSDILVHLRYPTGGAVEDVLANALSSGTPAVVYNYRQYALLPDKCVFKIGLRSEEGLYTVLSRGLKDRTVIDEMGSFAREYSSEGRASSAKDTGLAGFVERVIGSNAALRV